MRSPSEEEKRFSLKKCFFKSADLNFHYSVILGPEKAKSDKGKGLKEKQNTDVENVQGPSGLNQIERGCTPTSTNSSNMQDKSSVALTPAEKLILNYLQGNNCSFIVFCLLLIQPFSLHLGIKRYVRTTAGYVMDVKLEQRDQRKMLTDLKEQERLSISPNSSNEIGPSGKKQHSVFNKHLTMPLRKVEDYKLFEKQLDTPEIRNNLV